MSYMTEQEWIYLNKIIYLLNLGGDEKMKRIDFLRDLRVLIPYTAASFYLGDPTSAENPLIDPVGIDIPNGKFQAYEQYYYKVDYSKKFYPMVSSMIYREEDVFPNEQKSNSEYYHNYLDGIEYVLDANFANLAGFLGHISLSRKKELGTFTERDLFIMRILEPHITNRLYTYKLYISQNNQIDKKALYNQYNLSHREMQVLNLILQGKSTTDISIQFGISESTVKKHLSNIFQKFNVKNRIELTNSIMRRPGNGNFI